eukprot:COSAG01_NODE_4137_length_5306_cov_35.681390_2_plen_59_part_00
MVGGKENVSKTMTADGGRNALLRRRLMLRDEAEVRIDGTCSVDPRVHPDRSARSKRIL